MARVFLNNETYNAASDDAEITGSAGTEQVNVFNGVTGLDVKSSVERVDLPGEIADFTFSSFGNSLTIYDGDGNIVAAVSGADGKQLVFGDGSIDVASDGTTVTAGGETVTNDADNPAAIAPAASEIDAGTTSETADGTPNGDGQTFELTTGNDPVSGTTAADTITSESGTLNNGDNIVDATDGDGDVLNAVFKAADIAAPPTATISGVEAINIDIDAFAGTATTFDATNVTDATITLGSTKLGYDGDAGVTAAGDNNVTAGENVDTLTVAGLEDGVVDTGSADTASVTTAAATDPATVTVNGDVDLTVATATDLALTATAASVVTLTPGAVTDVTITGDVTLQGDAADLDGLVIEGGSVDVNAATAAPLDVEDFTVDGIEVSTAATITATDVQGQTFDLTAEDADLSLAGSGTAGDDVTLNVSANQAGGTQIVVNGVDTSTINLSADVEDIVSLTIEGDATVDAAGDTTIAALVATNATDTVTFTGAGSVDATGNTTDVAEVDASGLTGALTYAQANDAAITVTGGADDDSITLATVAADGEVITGDGENTVTVAGLTTGTLAVTGGADNDTVDVASVTTGTIAADLAGGDDTFVLSQTSGGGTYAIEFGAGADTLSLTDTEDLSTESITVAGLETIDMNGSVTLAASLVSGESFMVKGGGTANGTLTVDATVATGETVDLSSLMFDATTNDGVEDVTINGAGGDDVITGTDLVDTITGGGGADNYVFASQSQSTSTATDVITDFATTADTIDLSAVLGGSGSAATSITTAAGALDGTAAEFGGNAIAIFDDTVDTTVFVDVNGDDAFNAADDMEISLTGVTGGTVPVAADFLV